jgi:hypothetical protein
LGDGQENVIKAIVQDKYGSPDVLELRAIDKPVVGGDDVLVRVRAAAVGDTRSPPSRPFAIGGRASLGRGG